MSLFKYLLTLYQKLLSDKIKEKSEKIILSIAIASYIIHLALIYLVDFGLIPLSNPSNLLSNPIAAIYTPFSFILIYEVYLLIYYLPKSFTNYISKQYEIITLIIIRRLFKDLGNLTLNDTWFSIKYDLQFTYDLTTSLIMFFLIFIFYKQSKVKYQNDVLLELKPNALSRFIKIKKALAASLVPIFVMLALYSFANWLFQVFNNAETSSDSFSKINNVFFEEFFTVLIFADVFLLLFSFFLTDEFHKVIRNSGFIISTILIRLSFSTSGLLNNLLILCAIVFGLVILIIYNSFEKQIATESAVTKNTPDLL